MNFLENIRDLISIETTDEHKFRIHLPVLYADGENVCIDIIKNKQSFFVSDNGFGLENAFAQVKDIKVNDVERIGKTLSKQYGLSISKKLTEKEKQQQKITSNTNENGIVYLNEVSEEELNGAIMIIANVSRLFSQRLVEDSIATQENSLKEILDERLKFIYKSAYSDRVKKDVQITGTSTRQYKVSFVIEDNKKRLLEPVTNNTNSISPLFLKYSDIQQDSISKESIIRNIKEWDAGSIELIKKVSNQILEVNKFAA